MDAPAFVWDPESVVVLRNAMSCLSLTRKSVLPPQEHHIAVYLSGSWKQKIILRHQPMPRAKYRVRQSASLYMYSERRRRRRRKGGTRSSLLILRGMYVGGGDLTRVFGDE